MIKRSKLCKDENGAGLVVVIFVIFAVLAIGGLVVDLGIVYTTRGQMRKAANAAALSGIQEIFVSDASVSSIVDDILVSHNEKDHLESLQIKPNGENKVTVNLKKDVPLYFMKIFGKDSYTVKVSSSAKAAPLSVGRGAVPLGVPQNVINNIGTGEEYPLKVGPGDSEYGNFGIISLSDTWNIGRDYQHDLTYGSDGEIKINQILDTETGNVQGKTVAAIGDRLNSSQYQDAGLPAGDINLNDSRVLTVLVYQEMPHPGNQLKEVRVVGFAYFFLKGPYDQHNGTISGYFIKGLESGATGSGAVDKGAYGIRLVE